MPFVDNGSTVEPADGSAQTMDGCDRRFCADSGTCHVLAYGLLTNHCVFVAKNRRGNIEIGRWSSPSSISLSLAIPKLVARKYYESPYSPTDRAVANTNIRRNLLGYVIV